MNIAYHELMNGGTLMIDPNRDVNEVCAIILAGKQNGCVILGGGSPKNFYLQGQPTLWEVYGIPKGGNDYFIQITTDQVVWGGLSGATPAEAVSWGKVNPGVLPDTVVAYCDSTIAFPALLRVRGRAPQHNRRAAQGARAPARRARRRSAASGATVARDAEGSADDRAAAEFDRHGNAEAKPDLHGHPVLRARASSSNGSPSSRAFTRTPTCRTAWSGSCASKLGWDVLFVLEHDDLRRAPDIQHYRLARQLGRTLVTLDRDYTDDRRFPPAESPASSCFRRPTSGGCASCWSEADGTCSAPRARRRGRSRAARSSGRSGTASDCHDFSRRRGRRPAGSGDEPGDGRHRRRSHYRRSS